MKREYIERVPLIDFGTKRKFSEVLKEFKVEVSRKEKMTYSVMIILTSGAVDADDFNETKKQLAVLASCPVSVLIIGVGEGPFKNIEEL